MSRSRTASIALIGLPAAFALGCIPSGRLVSRLVGGGDISQSGDHKPGASNVARTLGWKPGAATLAVDLVKAAIPAAVGRRAGAGPDLTGALAVTPVVAHIAVVRGRGAAAALGAALAYDAPATALVLPAIVGGALTKRAASGVMVAALALPAISLGSGASAQGGVVRRAAGRPRLRSPARVGRRSGADERPGLLGAVLVRSRPGCVRRPGCARAAAAAPRRRRRPRRPTPPRPTRAA